MTEIIIDRLQTDYLIKRLREIFNPYIISDDTETVLNFKNEIGEGTFSIVTLDNDKLNIYFKGILYEPLDIKFYNAKQPALNFIYLQNGFISVKHDNEKTNLVRTSDQQLIYSSVIMQDEIISWPLEVLVEFNFLKVFDFSYLNSNPNDIPNKHMIDEVFKSYNSKPFEDIVAKKSKSISEEEPLIKSDLVGSSRVRDLEEKIRYIFKTQMKEVSYN